MSFAKTNFIIVRASTCLRSFLFRFQLMRAPSC